MRNRVREICGSLWRNYHHFPRNVHFSITHKCNLRCEFCGQGKTVPKSADELDLDRYFDIIGQVRALKYTTVSFSGGEIFLYPHLSEILAHCRKMKVKVSMVLTNGTLLTDERLSVLSDPNIQHVGFSIDGTDSVHDRIRGVIGAYGKTIAAIGALRDIREKSGRTTPTIGVNYVVTKDTIDHIEPFLGAISGLKVDAVRFQLLTYISRENLRLHREMNYESQGQLSSYLDGFYDPFPLIDEAKLHGLFESIRSKSRQLGIKVFFSHELPPNDLVRWYNTDDIVMSKCSFVNSSLLVLPNGDVPLCDFFRKVVGNVKERKITDLWNDTTSVRFRNERKNRVFHGCERCCHLA